MESTNIRRELGEEEKEVRCIIIKQEKRRIPLNYAALVKDADEEFDRTSVEAIAEQLYAGVLLNQGKKKYWVDMEQHTNCFMIFPRALDIANTEYGDKYWTWDSVVETRKGGCAEMAILKEVCYLNIVGTFNTMFLSPGVVYEVVFVIKMMSQNFGWSGYPVTLQLQLPDKSKQETQQSLSEVTKEEWIEIPAGDFLMSTNTVGLIEFNLYGSGGHWKGGLILKGVAIKPKKQKL